MSHINTIYTLYTYILLATSLESISIATIWKYLWYSCDGTQLNIINLNKLCFKHKTYYKHKHCFIKVLSSLRQ